MKKIQIKTKLQTPTEIYEFTCNAAYNQTENKIIYFEQDDLKTKVTLDINKMQLIRENSELHLDFKFDVINKTNNKIEIKEMKKIVEIVLQTEELIKKENEIRIKYYINNEKEPYFYEIYY